MKTLRVEIYKTNARKTPWTWRLRHRNTKIVANAAETFDSPGNAKRAGVNMAKLLGCEARVLNATDPTIATTVLEADGGSLDPAQRRRYARNVVNMVPAPVVLQKTTHPTAPQEFGSTVSQRVADDTRDDGSQR